MRYLAAYVLLVLGGNATPSAEQVSAVITAAGGEADEAALATLIGDLEGKDIHELLAKVTKAKTMDDIHMDIPMVKNVHLIVLFLMYRVTSH